MSIVKSASASAWTYPVNIPQGQVWQFTGFGFEGSDAITLQVKTSDEITYANYVDTAGTTPALSATNNSLQILGPFEGQWSKGSTTGDVGLRLYRNPLP